MISGAREGPALSRSIIIVKACVLRIRNTGRWHFMFCRNFIWSKRDKKAEKEEQSEADEKISEIKLPEILLW